MKFKHKKYILNFEIAWITLLVCINLSLQPALCMCTQDTQKDGHLDGTTTVQELAREQLVVFLGISA